MTYVVFPGNALIEARSFDDAWEAKGDVLNYLT